MRIADYIMNRLAEEGVRHVFQVTGRGALFLSDALAKSSELIGVSMHHEQACAFASIAYAEQSDKIGACLISTGCASTNTITGVLSAWQDGVPCIFISGQNILRETSRFTGIQLRTFGQQEADIVSIVEPITKYSAMLTRAEDIVEVMDAAIYEARSGRKGPVWVDVPLDLQSSRISPREFAKKNETIELNPISSESSQVEIVKSLLGSASRPVVLIGRGVRSSAAEEKLISFVEKLRIPLTFTASAPDTYGTENTLSIGSVGAMGCSRAGNFAVQNSDLVLVLGSRLTTLNTGPDFCKFARKAKIVVVDIDPIEHTKDSIKIDHFIRSDVGTFLDTLNTHLIDIRDNTDWINKCLHWKNIFSDVEQHFCSSKFIDLYQLADVLGKTMPRPSTLITDSGLNEVILPSNIKFGKGMRCIHPTSQGAMGFALPAAIGAQSYSSDLVLAVIGDGSIMMNIQELETIRNQKLPIKIIVINNNVYSIIRRRQQDLFRNRTIGTDPENGVSCPDFSKVADCFDLKYRKISHIKRLEVDIKAIFAMDGPVLCEIMGVVDQSYIEISNTKSLESKRFVRRPLEDQAPFLPRELFIKEMIIDPIDQ